LPACVQHRAETCAAAFQPRTGSECWPRCLPLTGFPPTRNLLLGRVLRAHLPPPSRTTATYPVPAGLPLQPKRDQTVGPCNRSRPEHLQDSRSPPRPWPDAVVPHAKRTPPPGPAPGPAPAPAACPAGAQLPRMSLGRTRTDLIHRRARQRRAHRLGGGHAAEILIPNTLRARASAAALPSPRRAPPRPSACRDPALHQPRCPDERPALG